MNKIWKKYEHALDYIESEYGGRKIELDYETPFQLLCAVILSAQTTDKQVNRVTPPLFARIKNPSDMYNISLEEIENYLQYINFFVINRDIFGKPEKFSLKNTTSKFRMISKHFKRFLASASKPQKS